MTKTRIKHQLTADAWAKAHKAEMPYTFEPMLATLEPTPFSHDDWIFERKLDGIRLLVFRDGAHVELYTRNGQFRNSHYPELVALFAAQPCERFVLDGEVVAFDGATTSFARLHKRATISNAQAARNSGIAVYFYVFDSPWIEDYDIRRLPLRDRKTIIRNVLDFSGRLRYTAHRDGDGEAFLKEACQKGWPGIIAKHADSPYRSGRSKRWLQLKCTAGQELVIGGMIDSPNSSGAIDALLMGFYQDDALHYAGRVDAGFTSDERLRLGRELRPLLRSHSPFVEVPEEGGVQWLAPERVAEIGFSSWTPDGRLSSPVYRGERDDKDARDVVREL